MARPLNFNPQLKLKAVMILFWKKGYHATSLSDLQEVTGLSKSSIYQAYGNKYDLFIAAFRMYHEEQLKQLQDIIQNGDNGYEAIETFLLKIVHAEDGLPCGCMTSNEAIEMGPHDQAFSQLINEQFQEIEEVFISAIDRGKKDQSITSHTDSLLLARFLMVIIQGINVMSSTKTNSDRVMDAVSVTKQILKGL
ncbi:TetR/AcrR family transcriptional regulator [Cytobacillus sp. OWB-43]|uniref:TetR/AcrR family transcriptional regulator n=1 Tax=unclassified Cytobacillus TaxID=2675268 RepID=UPI002B003DF9|nr:TetR/AcrR family transcriptional regulator [Cytobacillus sp. OWB-43]MEA1854177.1 TetR/AcrR family transcriptional regulator [Cytobacillus sp. OWB-43]